MDMQLMKKYIKLTQYQGIIVKIAYHFKAARIFTHAVTASSLNLNHIKVPAL